MKNDNENQWLDSLLARHIRREPEKFYFTKWAGKHPDEARLLRSSFEDSSRSTKTKPYLIWRFIMESKITRYSAAAVIALAATLILLCPFGTPGNGGVVLADIQQRVAEIETMVIRGQKTFMRPGEAGEIFEFDGIKCQFDLMKYFSKQHGHTEEGYVGDKLIYRITFNLPKRQTLIVIPPYKKYVTFTSTENVTKIMEDLLSPNGVINLLLESNYKELGRDNVDGVEVECFEFQEANPLKGILPKAVFDIQQGKGKVWIGIKEQLPVRIEGDVVIGKSLMTVFNDLNLHEINVLDKYNVELDEAIFDTSIPEGYTEFTISDILHLIPVEAKAGLAGLFIAPAGFIFWRRRRKRAATNPSN
jgi:hypothetical protein